MKIFYDAIWQICINNFLFVLGKIEILTEKTNSIYFIFCQQYKHKIADMSIIYFIYSWNMTFAFKAT